MDVEQRACLLAIQSLQQN